MIKGALFRVARGFLPLIHLVAEKRANKPTCNANPAELTAAGDQVFHQGSLH